MKIYPFLALSLVLASCKMTASTIAFYNVENLYDTVDQPHDDEEFLPEGKNQWTQERYLTKLNRINQVLDSMGTISLVGFGEVENRTVIEELNAASKDRKNFGTVHYDSPDLRGVDVALIYNPKHLTLVKDGFIRYEIENPNTPYTRDILWAKFTNKKDTIVAMVNHWPSRRGGQEQSEVNRLIAAKAATQFIDSIKKVSPNTQLIFMGDLNDYPEDKAPKMVAERLKPMITSTSGKFGGSYNYNGEWGILDHIMVSEHAMGTLKNFIILPNTGEIFQRDFILDTYKGQIVPKRNYAGSRYLDGYSDHLPVRIRVMIR